MAEASGFRALVVLRAKRGELDALAALDLDHGVQPVLSLGHNGTSSVDNLVDRVVEVTRSTYRLGRLMMLDATNMATAAGFDGAGAVLDHLAQRLSEPVDLLDLDPVPFIPVTHSAADERTLAATGRLARDLGHGCGLRVPMISATPETVIAAVERLGTRPSDLDLLVDLSYIAGIDAGRVDDVASLVEGLGGVGPFRSRTILSGSVPRTLSQLHRWEQQRFEEDLWRSLVAGGLDDLRLGDYGVAHPVWDPRGYPTNHINLKYTCGDHWLYLRERVLEADDESSGTTRTVRLVSRNLVASDSFYGSDYSWGDKRFTEAASGRSRALSRTKIVSFATSHHLAYLGGIAAA